MKTNNSPSPSTSFDYAAGYTEMRNMAAFVLNIIAGEIEDGIIDVDRRDLNHLSANERNTQDIEQQRKAQQVLRITHYLSQRATPSTLNGHDMTLDLLVGCMKAITSHYSGSAKIFGGHSPRLECIRLPLIND